MPSIETIRLKFDARQLDFFRPRLPKVLAYAAQEGLNATLKLVEKDLFKHVGSVFEVRQRGDFFGTGRQPGGIAARITAWASVKEGRAFGDIAGGTLSQKLVDASGERRLLFSYFERGGVRRPFTPGAKAVAEPVVGAARPSWPEKVLRQFTFAQMNLRPWYKPPKEKRKKAKPQRKLTFKKGMAAETLGYYGKTAIPRKSPGVQWKGRFGTFVKFTPALPHGGVFQRNPASKKDRPRLLWAFDPPFGLKRVLHWTEVARTSAQRYFSREIDKRIKERMEHEAAKAMRV